MGGQEPLELAAGQDQATQWARRHDVGDRNLAEQAGDLAEVLARPQRAALDVVDPNGRGSLEDDVEAGAADALPQDALALAEPGLVEDMHDLFELRPAQIGEEGES